MMLAILLLTIPHAICVQMHISRLSSKCSAMRSLSPGLTPLPPSINNDRDDCRNEEEEEALQRRIRVVEIESLESGSLKDSNVTVVHIAIPEAHDDQANIDNLLNRVTDGSAVHIAAPEVAASSQGDYVSSLIASSDDLINKLKNVTAYSPYAAVPPYNFSSPDQGPTFEPTDLPVISYADYCYDIPTCRECNGVDNPCAWCPTEAACLDGADYLAYCSLDGDISTCSDAYHEDDGTESVLPEGEEEARRAFKFEEASSLLPRYADELERAAMLIDPDCINYAGSVGECERAKIKGTFARVVEEEEAVRDTNVVIVTTYDNTTTPSYNERGDGNVIVHGVVIPKVILLPLFGQCFTSTEELDDYWTYKVCVGQFAKQLYREEGSVVGRMNFIGNYSATCELPEDSHKKLDLTTPSGQCSTPITPGREFSTLSQYYNNGDSCGDTNVKRSANVYFLCTTGESGVVRMDEDPPCVYNIHVADPTLCEAKEEYHVYVRPREVVSELKDTCIASTVQPQGSSYSICISKDVRVGDKSVGLYAGMGGKVRYYGGATIYPRFIMYTGGAECPKAGTFSETKVFLSCSMDGVSEIYKVEEAESCRHTLWARHPGACKSVDFPVYKSVPDIFKELKTADEGKARCYKSDMAVNKVKFYEVCVGDKIRLKVKEEDFVDFAKYSAQGDSEEGVEGVEELYSGIEIKEKPIITKLICVVNPKCLFEECKAAAGTSGITVKYYCDLARPNFINVVKAKDKPCRWIFYISDPIFCTNVRFPNTPPNYPPVAGPK